jgi:hypothetical protein
MTKENASVGPQHHDAPRERFVSQERAAINRIEDPLYKLAMNISYRIGIGNGLGELLVYPLLKLQREVEELRAQLEAK